MTTILRQSPGAPEAPESDARRPSGRAGHGLAMVIIAAALPTLMTALDDLVMTFALPVIQKAMNASVTQLQWFVNAYTIVFAALLLPAAALGDRFGRRRVFLIGITVFTGASAWAAVSGSSAMLIAARAVEGAGAAAIVTLSLALLADMVPPAKRPMAIGIWGGVNGIGTAAGPIVGGAVIQGLHWSAIFWINVPVGVVAIVLALVSLRGAAAARGSQERRGIDLLGMALGIASIFMLVWTIVEAPDHGWTSARTLLGLAVALACVVCFLMRERRARSAFLPVVMFRDRVFSAANAATFLFAGGVFGAIFLLSQFLEVSMGYSALGAGWRAVPWTLMPMVMAPIVGLIVQRIGVRLVLMIGLGLEAVALLWMALVLSPGVTYGAVIAPMFVGGVGMGLSFAPLSTAALQGRQGPEYAVASGVNSTLRQVGVTLGVAVCTAIFTSAGSYRPGQPFVDGLLPALWMCVGVLVVGVGVCGLISPATSGARNSA